MNRPAFVPPEAPDLREKGAPKDGQPQTSDRRLFMQFLAWTGSADTQELLASVKASGLEQVLYADVNDPLGVGLLTLTEDPQTLVTKLRPMLAGAPWKTLTPKPEFTMLGRTYSLGYEPDLEDTLLARPRRTVNNPAWPWAVWYPLRRKGSFAQLPEDQQKAILMEHGKLGFAFGSADLGHDVRLACYGLDKHDNDFVIGLIGKELHPLSALVQAMRKTQQTSLHLERLGPFFVGHAIR